MARLRLLPTAQAIRAHGTRGRKETEVSDVQLEKAFAPTLVSVCGSLMEVRPAQPANADLPIVLIL